MKKAFTVLNILLGAVVLIGMAVYMQHGTLLIKGSASGCFVLLGLTNLIYALAAKPRSLRYPLTMACGLILAMLGDIFLGVDFILGAGLFALGHVLYTLSFFSLAKFRWLDALLGGGIFILSALIILLTPSLDFDGALMQGVCLVYALVISCMVGKALSNFIHQRGALTAVIALGSFLFYFSDLMLLLYVFGDAPRIVDRLCLLTYFPAQGLLAHSIYRFVKENA